MNTIVVTGITSFVGFYLSRFFKHEGYRVIGTSTGARGNDDEVVAGRLAAANKTGVEIQVLDLTDNASVNEFIARYRPDYWIHHAGWTKNYRSFDFDLGRAFAINVLPLSNVFDALKKNGCRGVIVTGTESEYTESRAAHREEDQCMPATAYGLSKLCETIHTRQNAFHHGLPARVARLFIPYGPLDAPQKVMGSTVKALRGKKEIALSSCSQSRDFIHVEDVVKAYGALIEDMNQRSELFDIFNICSGNCIILRDVLVMIANQLGGGTELLKFGIVPMPESEGPVCYGDNSKALKLLNWKPGLLEDGIKKFLSSTE